MKSGNRVEPENNKNTGNPAPIKRLWLGMLGVAAIMKAELSGITLGYIESTPMNRTNIIHRSQKKQRKIARRRNEFSRR